MSADTHAPLPPLAAELEALGILARERLRPFYPRVRDRDDITVLRDPLSEVIVLSSSEHMSLDYYAAKPERSGHAVDGRQVETPRLEDNIRRTERFGALLRNRRWLDFGCGLGGMLDEFAGQAALAVGLEPNRQRAAITAAKGHAVVGDLDEIGAGSLDIISMFHVLEHLTEPSRTLARLRSTLKPGGTLLIEVPHARDALLTLYDCEPFKAFTFWSEHLVLHTRQSLRLLLEGAGFAQVEISGQQRYPVSNHLHWLSKQAPGGHQAWAFLDADGLHAQYEAALARIDRTDTLIATARVPSARDTA
ncbi:class I SAM-dependent methyltransferase [Xanthomonas campestris]|uniref:class I SAM-dependent methyltransferase n=1 Tax=Xanthomonas campestris TaxID=339 RepID=UPI000E0E0B81|nr:class I SAM-dependent methyltransferase [Xanthomonas campestris]